MMNSILEGAEAFILMGNPSVQGMLGHYLHLIQKDKVFFGGGGHILSNILTSLVCVKEFWGVCVCVSSSLGAY